MSLDSLTSALIDKKLRDACRELELRLRSGEQRVTEQLLEDNPDFESSADNALELIYCEVTTREELGDRPTPDELFERFPKWRGRIQRLLEVHDAISDDDDPAVAAGLSDTSPSLHSTLHGGEKLETFPDLPPMRQIGSYELITELGRGGTGVVYRARQVTLGRMVAVKLINEEHAGREQLLRFHAEAEAAAHLQHPNIVQIHEVGTENGCSYISLELVEGGSLAEKLAKSSLEPDDAATLMAIIARAMEYAHARGIVHRDLKPANILLTAEGDPKIADFGLAKRSWEHERKKTRDGTILGTPGYMAPEQALGNNAAVGPSADVYAMGAILYELLTGRAPFQAGGLLETLEQVRLLDPVPPRQLRPRLSRDLETICLKCLHKQPESRYRRAAELAEDLDRYLAREPIQARQVTWPERCATWVRRRPAIASLIAAVAIVAVVGMAGVFWQWNKSEHRRAALEKAFGEVKQAQAKEAKQRERLNGTAYLQRVAASYGEWLANHPVRAEQLMENCEPDLRGWEWHYLNRLMHSEQWTLDGHTLPVKGLAFSPDGRWIASSSAAWGYNTPGEIIVWDAKTGEKLHVLWGHDGPILDVAFSPDGSRIASAGGRWGGSSEVIVWETATGKQLNSVPSRCGLLMDVEYSPDGKWLGACGLGGLAQIWHSNTLEEYHLITGHTGMVFRVAFSPDNKTVATCSYDSTVRLWNLETNQLIIALTPGPNVRTMAFSPDGSRLAAGSWNGIVKVWKLKLDSDEVAQEIAHHQLHSERVRAMEFSPDGQYLGVACSDGSLRIWHPINGAEVRHFYAHSGSAINIAFHPEGHRLVTSGIDQKVKYWDLAADQEPAKIYPHEAEISAFSLSPNGELLAVVGGLNHINLGAGQKTLNVWNFAKKQNTHQLAEHTDWLTSVAFGPRGDVVLSGSNDQIAILWDLATSKAVQRFKGHQGAVMGVAFLPSEGQVATSSADHTIKFWNSATGAELATLEGHDAAVTALAVSVDRGLLATASEDATVRIWNIAERRVLDVLRGHTGGISDVQFSPDGTLVASCGADGKLLVWQLNESPDTNEAWTIKYRLQLKNSGNIKHIAFNPAGTRLVGTSEDSSLTLWDMGTGQEAFSQRTGPESLVVGDVEFTPDGKRLISSYSTQVAIRSIEGNSPHEFSAARAFDWHKQRASTCQSDSNSFGALVHFNYLVALQPEHWMNHFGLADNLSRQNQWEAAEKAYAEAETRIAAVGELSRAQKMEIAKQYYQSAHIQHSGGRVPVGKGMFDKASQYLESILETTPNDTECIRQLAQLKRDFGYLYRPFDDVEARRALERGIALGDLLIQANPKSATDQVNLCNALLNLATIVPMDQRQPLFERAQSLLEPIVKQNSTSKYYREQLALCLDDYGAWLENNGQHDTAVPLMMRALDIRVKLVAEYPNNLGSLNLLARSYYRMTEPTFDCVPREQAKEFWRSYLTTLQVILRSQTAPISPSTANDLSWHLATCPFEEFRDPERAVEWGKVASKGSPGNGHILNTLGIAQYRNGQWPVAQRTLTESMQLRKGGDSFDWYYLAMISWHLGNHDEAREWLSKSNSWMSEHLPRDAALLRLRAEVESLVTPAS